MQMRSFDLGFHLQYCCFTTMQGLRNNGLAYAPSKETLPVSGLDPHLIYSSFGSHKSAPKTASRSLQSFLHRSLVCRTHRHTDHAMCDICGNRPHLMYCLQACGQNTRNSRNLLYIPGDQLCCPSIVSTITVITGPTNGPVLFCSLTSVVCLRRL